MNGTTQITLKDYCERLTYNTVGAYLTRGCHRLLFLWILLHFEFHP